MNQPVGAQVVAQPMDLTILEPVVAAMDGYRPKGPFPLFIKDLKEDTIGWDAAARWRYLCVLEHMFHQGGYIPDDLAYLAEISGTNRARNWRESLEKLRYILLKSDEKPNFLTNKRVLIEVVKANKRSGIASKGGKAKAERKAAVSTTPAVLPTPTPKESKKDTPLIPPILTTKQGTNASKTGTVDEAFERFWGVYPSRDGAPNPKKPAREKFHQKVKAGTLIEDIQRGVEGFAASVAQRREREGKRFDAAGAVCQAVTFLSQERYDDYRSEAEPPLTDEQRAVLKKYGYTPEDKQDGGKRPWKTPNVIELRLGPGPPEQAYETAMDAHDRECAEASGG